MHFTIAPEWTPAVKNRMHRVTLLESTCISPVSALTCLLLWNDALGMLISVSLEKAETRKVKT